MTNSTTLAAKDAEQIEQLRDKALCMLAFVNEALKENVETMNWSGAPLEGLVHILDAIETDLCEAHLLEAGK